MCLGVCTIAIFIFSKAALAKVALVHVARGEPILAVTLLLAVYPRPGVRLASGGDELSDAGARPRVVVVAGVDVVRLWC